MPLTGKELLKSYFKLGRAPSEEEFAELIDAIPEMTTIFTIEGSLLVEGSPFRIYNVSGISRTISKVFISVNVAPVGSSMIVDIHRNGTTIFTTQSNRPSILENQFSGFSETIEVSNWGADEYLQLEIDQIGSSIPGSDLTVHVLWS